MHTIQCGMAVLFFDFDSTVVSKETLDHTIASLLLSHPDRERMIAEIEEITRLGMEGQLDFKESIKRRIASVPLTRQLLEETGQAMLAEITPGMRAIFGWLRQRGHEIFIASGGYFECVQPVAHELGIDDDHIFTNRFLFSQNGMVVGFDETALLWTNDGKTPVLKEIRTIRADQTIVMVGDGANDLKAFESGAADIFIGFGAHTVRDTVKARAEHFVHSAPELLTLLQKLL